MPWIYFAILLCLFTAIQTAVMPFVALHSIVPNLLVILAAHYALAARRHDALLAGWFIGLMMDLTSLDTPVGLHAFCLGLIAFGLVRLRAWMVRDSVVTQMLTTAGAAFALAVLTGLYVRVQMDRAATLRSLCVMSVYAALYTAFWSPYVHWLLGRLRPWLGLGSAHRLRVG